MKQRMTTWPLLLAMGLSAVGLAACSGSSGGQQDVTTAVPTSTMTASGPRDAADREKVTTPLAKPVQDSGGMTVVDSHSTSQKTYLYDLMQQPVFAKAYAAMDGSDKLPEWVSKGGTATPVEVVTVEGQSLLAARACKPHSCPSERVVLLFDRSQRSMQGVFVRNPDTLQDAGSSDKMAYTWLGQPDAAVKAWLKKDLAAH